MLTRTIVIAMAFAIVIASAGAAFASTARAAVIVTNTTLVGAAFTVSNSDLLQGASVIAEGSFSREGEVGTTALTDGSFGAIGSIITGNSGLAAATADGGNSLTYTLSHVSNLTSISSYAGWDAYRGGQSYTVSYATAAAPTTFVALATEFNDAQGGGDINTRAFISSSAGFLAANVAAVKFTFSGDLTYGYAGYRELDVFGSNVPEPSSWALFLAGFGAVGLAFRRRTAFGALNRAA